MKYSQKRLYRLNYYNFNYRIFQNPQKSIIKYSCPQTSPVKPSWFCTAWTTGVDSCRNNVFLASRHNERKGNEREQLLGWTEQLSCSTDHVLDGWQKWKMIYSWEASYLVCTPKMKAVISQMGTSLLPSSSLYKQLGEQEEATGESRGGTESQRTMTERKGLQKKMIPRGKCKAEQEAARQRTTFWILN